MARHWSSLASVELQHREGFVLVAAAARSRSRKVSATDVTMTAANRSKAVHASQSATSSKVGGGAGGLNGGDGGVGGVGGANGGSGGPGGPASSSSSMITTGSLVGSAPLLASERQSG